MTGHQQINRSRQEREPQLCFWDWPSHLATYPIPRVLFSTGEGKRCWLLSRDASVDMRDPRYCLLTPVSSGEEKGPGSKGGTLGPQGMDP